MATSDMALMTVALYCSTAPSYTAVWLPSWARKRAPAKMGRLSAGETPRMSELASRKWLKPKAWKPAKATRLTFG
ncbi:hypothetical protein D9M68_905260 [compost metagenome]